MNVRFVVTKPESKRKTFSVRLPLLVGRGEEAKFRIQQDRVSRRHCEFFEQDGGVYLRDLGSTNGTFVNGALVETSAKCPLEPGSVVRVGSLEFRVEFDAESAAPVAIGDDASGDRTVGVALAADSEHLQVEHAALDADRPLVAPAVTPTDEPAPASEPEVVLTAERPAALDEAPQVEVADLGDLAPANSGAAEPSAGGGFGFLGEADDANHSADDDQLGDFLKGLG